jgi:hypothetical protein
VPETIRPSPVLQGSIKEGDIWELIAQSRQDHDREVLRVTVDPNIYILALRFGDMPESCLTLRVPARSSSRSPATSGQLQAGRRKC